MSGLFYVWNSEVVGVNIHFWHSATIRHKSAARAGQSNHSLQEVGEARQSRLVLVKKKKEHRRCQVNNRLAR